jgi:hypothetical protein
MADRYWVGGSGTWNNSSTTNWSTSSGGSSGASAPTIADNVIFDSSSNLTGYTVTVGTNAACLDLTATGPLTGTVTFSLGATAAINCRGSMTLPATGLTWTGTAGCLITFSATTTGKTIQTNDVILTLTSITCNGVGGAWTLGSALTYGTGQTLSITNGTFNTGNFNVTGAAFAVNSVGTQVINLGSSTLTLSLAGSAINFTQTAGLTFNANTSQINCSATAATITGGGQTFYNVSFTSNAAGNTTITGANTFNNLTQTSRNATGNRVVILGANQTVNGTLTLGAANTAIRRILVISDVFGTQRTITLNGTLATLADVDFRNIATAGTVGTWSGTRLGNALGNSGITFSTAKDVYWNLVAGGSWSSTGWALSSGGGVDVNNFPLAQDKAIIENTGLNTSAAIVLDNNWSFGEIDISTRTNAMTFTTTDGLAPRFYKNVTLSSAVTMTGTSSWQFSGQGTTQILDVNTVTFTNNIIIESTGGTLQLAENTTFSNTVTLTSGTLNLNNNILSCNIFSSDNANTRSIAFGTGKIQVRGNAATVFTTSNITNFSYTGTSNIELTYSGGTGTRTITNGSPTEAQALNFSVTAGTDIISITRVRTLDFTGFSGTLSDAARIIYGNLVFSSGMTLTAGTNALTFSATSSTQQVTTNNKTLDFPVTHNGVGGTVRLEDNLTMGSTRTYTLTNGTLNVNSRTLTAGIFSSSNSNTRNLNLGTNGKIAVNGGGWTATVTGFTFSGTGTISMDLATAKTFAGGGGVYPYTLNQGGAGTLTITGANTFSNITNTNATASQITFPASTTTTVTNFNVSGTAGNLVSLRSSTNGTRYTLLRQDVIDPLYINVDYLDVRDASGSPDLKWYVGNNSVNSGNNLQIYFEEAPVIISATFNGSAAVTANGLRIRVSNGDITGQGLFSGSAFKIAVSSVNITGEGAVTASAGRRTNGSANITGNATIVVNGKIIGEEWGGIAVDPNTWTDTSVTGNNWTDISIGNQTWQ